MWGRSGSPMAVTRHSGFVGFIPLGEERNGERIYR
jgi:hypothetical protein